jgi:hypothetical protein
LKTFASARDALARSASQRLSQTIHRPLQWPPTEKMGARWTWGEEIVLKA